jgi:hypothetical protein
VVIKNDNTWTVAGTVNDGRVLIENESINLKRAIEGANDHWIKINDKNNIEVFREMDSKKWLLVRVDDKIEPNWAGGCKFEEERYNREAGWNDCISLMLRILQEMAKTSSGRTGLASNGI